jgi:dTDP-4-amino-4,6-dideoxygalactose transaminase
MEAHAMNYPVEEPVRTVELLRPLLPDAAAILPYIERIDAARWYSNFGPLEQELRSRLGAHFGLSAEHTITASSATAGLISVLRALNIPKDSLCLVPSWTFVATPASAIAAELTPYFIDVDEASWALTPDLVKKQIAGVRGIIGAVLVVAPFGKRVDIAAWDRFTAETSIPVVVDAASGFDSFRTAQFGRTPIVFSLHATKIIGAGEGAVVVSRDTALLRHVHEQTNFGYYTRRISIPGINSKMSEYTAAVAHAALDNWPERRAQWKATTDYCMAALAPLAKKHNVILWFPDDGVSSTCNIRIAKQEADLVISQLQVRGIKARQWWDKGCHLQPAYSKYAHTELEVTHRLGHSVISLPFYVDIPREHLDYVAHHLADILDSLST